ncbi:hypothetical protein SAMN05660865_01008 [Caloramator fervidus]|uniref:Alpha-glucosidase n=1 Tax=Caloramator fervidus TaxID=29344 RepID=A0A1H5UWC7_9CLOT|nr:hypothetical protein [Caloramator fervidus]SEF78738.1 hypothetical protein SAMN05660865_01008 [Caloramator fervidus]
MDKVLFCIFDDLIKKIKLMNLKNKDKYIYDIERIKSIYKGLEIKKDKKIILDSIIKNGRELLKEDVDFKNKLEVFIRYCYAAIYDFEDNLKPLKNITLSFTISCMLFMILSPQYLSYMLPLLMIIPIFLGLRGMKKRSLNGLILGLSVMPMTVLNSTIILKNAYLVRNNLDDFLMDIAKVYGKSLQAVKFIFTGSLVLGIIMLVTSTYTIYLAYKHRKMFV